MSKLVENDSFARYSEDLGRTSTSLLVRLRSSDQSAWGCFVALYGPLVYFWCRNARLQASDAADVGQEVFQSVARKIADFRRDRPGDSFRAWLKTIARNKIFDFHRKRSTREAATGGSDAHQAMLGVAAPDELETDIHVNSETEQTERTLLLRQALAIIRDSFDERRWAAFWRVTVELEPPKAVASDLKISVNAVYLAKSRVLRRLKEEFGDLMELGKGVASKPFA